MPPTKKPSGRFLHYEPERVDYSVTEAELEILERGNSPLWKDITLVMFPLGISALINAIAEIRTQQGEFRVTLQMLLNLIFGIVGILLGCAFGIAWKRSGKTFKDVIARLKAKPKLELPADFLGPRTKTEAEEMVSDPGKKLRKPRASKRGKSEEADEEDADSSEESSASDEPFESSPHPAYPVPDGPLTTSDAAEGGDK
jgi:hypothetical protein